MKIAGKIHGTALSGNLMHLRLLRELRSGLSREQIICLGAAAVFAVLSIIAGSGGDVLKDGNELLRQSPGTGDKEYEIKVEGISDKEETIRVRVSERSYTKEEAEQNFAKLMEELSAHMVGDNESLEKVIGDLNFPKSVKGYEGISLSWYPEDSSLIGYDGSVSSMDLDEAKKTFVRVILKAGEYTQEYVIPVCVMPAEQKTPEELLEKLEYMIEKADGEQVYDEKLVLPESLNGISLRYSSRRNYTWVKILIGGISAAILIGLRPEQERRRKEKERELALLADYSEMASKLIIYMGAGLTVRNAWLRIADNYAEQLSNGSTEEKPVYEEMRTAAAQLLKGVPETKAYMDFAQRCSLKCYTKFISILEQNLKTGDSRSEDALRMEIKDAFEERKNLAKRQGEEAGTKLMLPLMISLMTVMAITVVPAMLTLM